jgi:hypothetical protein
MECTLVKKLEEIQWQERVVQGTPWYALMSNPKYVDDFCYIGPHF